MGLIKSWSPSPKRQGHILAMMRKRERERETNSPRPFANFQPPPEAGTHTAENDASSYVRNGTNPELEKVKNSQSEINGEYFFWLPRLLSKRGQRMYCA